MEKTSKIFKKLLRTCGQFSYPIPFCPNRQACEIPASQNEQSHYTCDDNGDLKCLPGVYPISPLATETAPVRRTLIVWMCSSELQVGKAISAMCRYAAKDAIQCKAIANDRANVVAILDFMVINANGAFHCPDVSTERNGLFFTFDRFTSMRSFSRPFSVTDATCRSSAFAIKAGTVYFVRNVSGNKRVDFKCELSLHFDIPFRQLFAETIAIRRVATVKCRASVDADWVGPDQRAKNAKCCPVVSMVRVPNRSNANAMRDGREFCVTFVSERAHLDEKDRRSSHSMNSFCSNLCQKLQPNTWLL